VQFLQPFNDVFDLLFHFRANGHGMLIRSEVNRPVIGHPASRLRMIVADANDKLAGGVPHATQQFVEREVEEPKPLMRGETY
jgi:hypothetical protein